MFKRINELSNEELEAVNGAKEELDLYGFDLPCDAEFAFTVKGYTQAELKQIFKVDYSFGELVKRKAANRKSLAETANHNFGYCSVALPNGKMAQKHQVIMLMRYGFVTKEIHHADNNKENNAIYNLWPSSRLHNLSFPRSSSSTGILNIRALTYEGKEYWSVTVNRKGYKPMCKWVDVNNLEQAIYFRDTARKLLGHFPATDNPVDDLIDEYSKAQLIIAISENCTELAAELIANDKF